MSVISAQAAEQKVLNALRKYGGGDFGFVPFAPLQRATRLDRKTVRRACRSLASKGLAIYAKGLWTEDGRPAGSGYAARERLGRRAAAA